MTDATSESDAHVAQLCEALDWFLATNPEEQIAAVAVNKDALLHVMAARARAHVKNAPAPQTDNDFLTRLMAIWAEGFMIGARFVKG